MEPPQHPFVLEIWHAVMAIATAALIGAWRYVTGNIKELKENTVTKTEFSSAMGKADKQRDEFRESIIKLYDGQADITVQMNEQHVKILNAIYEVARK